ncbi:hypothetical protein [Sphingomonas phage Kimi]|nr:hypothetical protein [Sphingomonas phage Kimi]
MAAHRYWRVRFIPISGNQGSCAELQLRESVGGPNVASGGTPYASTVNGALVAANAFDGNNATHWQSTNVAQDPRFIGYDFGAGNEKDIYEIAWTASTLAVAQNPGSLWLEWSDNNADWTEVLSAAGIAAWTTGLTRTYDADPPNARMSGLVLEAHPPNARMSGLVLEAHPSFNPKLQVCSLVLEAHTNFPIPKAQIRSLTVEAHTNLSANTLMLATGLVIEAHTSITQRPIDTLPYQPEAKLTEKLEWLTDILPNYNGTEQRVSARALPRRSFTYDISVLNDRERKQLYDVYYNSASHDFYAPAYAYQSWVKQTAAQGSNVIYANMARSDIRANDDFLVITKTGKQYIYRVQERYDDRIVIGRPLEGVVERGSIITPVYLGRFSGTAALGMKAISGTSQLTVDITRPRSQEALPYVPVTLPTFDGHVLLDRRPLGAGDAPEEFDAGVEVIDNKTGLPQYYTAWFQRYVGGNRSYLINPLFDWDDLQFWRTFFDYCRGRQRAFLTPTYRQDQIPVAGVPLSAGSVTVEGDSYTRLYRNSPTYSRLEIATDKGTFRVKVAGAVYSGGQTTINFVDAIPDDITDAAIERVSYLVLARLGSDTVTLNHDNNFITVETSLRAVVE